MQYLVYSVLPLKYTLWTGATSTHLVGRCVLYSYYFLDPLFQWIAMGNGWNLRQPAWPKPNDVKSREMSSFLNIDDTNNKEYCVVMLEGVDEVLGTMQIEEKPPIDDKI